MHGSEVQFFSKICIHGGNNFRNCNVGDYWRRGMQRLHFPHKQNRLAEFKPEVFSQTRLC